MILQTARGGNIEVRAGEWGYDHIIPSPGYQYISDAGLPINEADAYGLPAVSNVIRSAAGLVASLPFFIYRDDESREQARDSWQWKLLHDQPAAETSSFDFFYDIALSIESTSNAFVRKAKFRDQVLELEVLDPHRVRVYQDQDSGEKLFDIFVSNGKVIRKLTSETILHVRGFTPNPGSVCGISLIEVHRNVLSSQKYMQRFEGDYFRKGGIPPFWFTGASNSAHAQEIVDGYKAHRDRAMNGDPGGLWGQIDVKSIPISMQDAMYAENKQLSVEDACAIWDWPVWMVRPINETGVDRDIRMSEFLRTKFLPRLRRIERAFASDPDLFGSGGLFGEFLIHALERADFVNRVRGYKDAIQGGWIAPNEVRRFENLPPSDDPRADELQQTPVGGAANEPPGGPTNEESNVND